MKAGSRITLRYAPTRVCAWDFEIYPVIAKREDSSRLHARAQRLAGRIQRHGVHTVPGSGHLLALLNEALHRGAAIGVQAGDDLEDLHRAAPVQTQECEPLTVRWLVC